MDKENKGSTACLDENYIAKMHNAAAKDEMVWLEVNRTFIF